MVIKVFISGISASKEVKKRQQRALLILDSCKVDYEAIDITEPGLEEMREFMQQNSKVREPNKTAAAPQFYNEDVYCGDFEDFDSAVEVNQVLTFLKLQEKEVSNAELILNETPTTKEKVSTNGVNHDKDEDEIKEDNETNENQSKGEEQEEQAEPEEEVTTQVIETREVIKESTPTAQDKTEEEEVEEEEEEDEEGEA